MDPLKDAAEVLRMAICEALKEVNMTISDDLKEVNLYWDFLPVHAWGAPFAELVLSKLKTRRDASDDPTDEMNGAIAEVEAHLSGLYNRSRTCRATNNE